MKTLIYLVFIYFSTRGILINYKILPDFIDASLNILFRGSFVYWFASKLIEKKFYKFKGSGIITALIGVTLLSGFINLVSINQLSRFVLNVFGPISVFYYISYYLNYNSSQRLFKFIYVYYIIQFIFSIYINLDTFQAGRFLIDDPFFGFYGNPRAYAFSFASSLISGILIFDYLETKKNKKLLIAIPLFLTQILAGAGIIFIVTIITLIIAFLYYSIKKKQAKNLIIGVLISIILTPTIYYYKQSMQNFNKVIDNIGTESLENNPKILYFIKSVEPIINDPIAMTIGFGPGNYMSWTSKQFRTDLVKKFNDDLHDTLFTDAYQAFNNVVGFWGDLGLPGMLLFYAFVITITKSILKECKETNEKTQLLFLIIFSLIQSILVQVFDDSYYSLIFWILLGILFNKIKHRKENLIVDSTQKMQKKEIYSQAR